MSFDSRRIVPGGQWFEVLISFEDAFEVDAIMEKTKEAALAKAYWNWEDAVEIVFVEDIDDTMKSILGIA